jgi:FAD/FMN-containing dehydrogenase
VSDPAPHIPDRQELAALVRDWHAQATPWLPCGLGSRLDWGPPVLAGSAVLSCRRLNRILEHNPGDFTVTVEAGTTLVDLQAALAEENQWLAIDWPWQSGSDGSHSGSIGGLVARGLSGGLRQRHLGIRDQLIGLQLLRVDGTAARAGGKVVKNVAGYDLMRLFTGSWGSLGLITAVTLRTQPRPPQRRGLWIPGDLPSLAAFSAALLASSLTPERLDWWTPALTASLPAVADGPARHGLALTLSSISPSALDDQQQAVETLARRHTTTSPARAPGGRAVSPVARPTANLISLTARPRGRATRRAIVLAPCQPSATARAAARSSSDGGAVRTRSSAKVMMRLSTGPVERTIESSRRPRMGGPCMRTSPPQARCSVRMASATAVVMAVRARARPNVSSSQACAPSVLIAPGRAAMASAADR